MATRYLVISWTMGCLLTMQSGKADILVNGDFESGDLTGWSFTGSPAPEIIMIDVHGGDGPSWAPRVHVTTAACLNRA